MAKHNFMIERYQITLGDHPKTFGGNEVRPRGVVACFGEFLRLIYYFLPDGVTPPESKWSEDARLNIDTDSPGDSFISTLHEPVGEEEKGGLFRR
jgi:hypothetical protein